MKTVKTLVQEFEENIDKNKLYTAPEVANLLGISKEAVYKWIRNKRIDSVQIGDQYRILGSDILKKISYHTRET